MIDSPALRDAAGNTAVRDPSRTFLLSPGQRISREEEVFTPPRGAVRSQSLRVYHVRYELYQTLSRMVFRKTSYEMAVRTLVDVLVDTVAHMQKDLAMLREENRVLRTRATSQVMQAPRRAALTTTKVPRFDGTTSWEQYHQVFEAIVRSNAGRMIKQHCNCSRIYREMR